MQELWAPIEGFSSIYEVSNTAKVRSVKSGKVLEAKVINGRNVLTLSRDTVHRRSVYLDVLVATAFCKPVGFRVLHKNGKRLDDCADNLQWYDDKLCIEHGLNKPVEVLTVSGIVIDKCPSRSIAAKKYGYTVNTVSRCCRTGTATRQGYCFRSVSNE